MKKCETKLYIQTQEIMVGLFWIMQDPILQTLLRQNSHDGNLIVGSDLPENYIQLQIEISTSANPTGIYIKSTTAFTILVELQ